MKSSFAVRMMLAPALFVCLASTAAADEALSPISAALAWLKQEQNPESGCWGEASVRDTSLVLQALQGYPGSSVDYSAARDFLSTQQEVSTDYRARKIAVLRPAGYRCEQDIAVLLAGQNSDGSFGLLSGYPGSVIDSLLALEALTAAGVDDNEVIGKALGYIAGTQRKDDGAFSYAGSGPASLEVTCLAVTVMCMLQQRYNVSSHIGPAAGFIVARQNADGGFGEDGSSVVETACAIRALKAAGDQSRAVSEARTYLLSVQDPEGSWNERVRDTALGLAALYDSAGSELANLQVHPDGMSILPRYPANGQQVTVACEVRNTGSIAAEGVLVEFYLGDPDLTGQYLGSKTIAELSAGGRAEVMLSFALTAPEGPRAIHVIVDPHNTIPEITRADNTAVKGFTIGTLPDLVIVHIAPGEAAPRAGEPFVLAATVSNLGESDAGSVTVGLYPGDPETNDPLLEVSLGTLCGGCSCRADFELTLPAGTYEYIISVSAEGDDVERIVNNNARACTVTVEPALCAGLDLAVTETDISFSPPCPRENEPISVMVAIRNRGDVAARDAVVELHAVDALSNSRPVHVFSGVHVPAGGTTKLALHDERFAAGTHEIIAQVFASPALDAAVVHFRKAADVGRTLFPKRVRKDAWWSDHSTRPYIRGLSNLAIAYNRLGRYDEALAICDQLVLCNDWARVNMHRGRVFLNVGRYDEAATCFATLTGLWAREGYSVAFALLSQRKEQEALPYLLRAVLNHPRHARLLVGSKIPKPRNREEWEDDRAVWNESRDLHAWFLRDSKKPLAHLRQLLRHPSVQALTEEIGRLEEQDRRDRDQTTFHRLLEVKSKEFAETVARSVGLAPPVGAP